jgi:hypothetical protein
MSSLLPEMHRSSLSGLRLLVFGGIGLGLVAASPTALAAKEEVELEASRIYIEYNSTDNDLGFHVLLDGEDWRSLKIHNPGGKVVFEVTGRAGYRDLGMTELFFEGAEPELADVPLDELLSLFPEGEYEFEGVTVDGTGISGEGSLSHAVPAGPDVADSDDVVVPGNPFVIRWNHVTEKATDPEGGVFPARPINVVAYQIIVGSFQVTLPASGGSMSVAVPPEYVATLDSGSHDFEVLAIDASGNQTITSGTFTK